MQRPFALLLASLWLVACGANSQPAVDLDPGDDDSGIDPDAPIGDSSGPTFDVSQDTNIDDGALNPDSACATTKAEAIKPPVDIIMVVDQSGSMSNEIANVKANINKLSDFLGKTGLDYRVVMIGTKGTSTYQLCVPPPLGLGSPTCDSNPPLLRVVNRNVQSWDALKIVLETYDTAPGTATAWADFLRKDAFKVFIPVTDDNSQGSGNPTATTFDTQLLAKPGEQFGTAAKRNYSVYPICGAPAFPAESPKCSTAVNTGATYVELAKLTKGQWFPVCSTDYGPIFEEMGKSIATRVACEFTVPPPPEGETLDPDKVNVSYTPGTGGSTQEILKDDSKPCESGANGWQYNTEKTKILLCGDACKQVQDDLGAKVDVIFGCQTIVKPPA